MKTYRQKENNSLSRKYVITILLFQYQTLLCDSITKDDKKEKQLSKHHWINVTEKLKFE